MARFLAIHNVSGLTEEEFQWDGRKFRERRQQVAPGPPHHDPEGLRGSEARQAGHRVRGGGAGALRGLDQDDWLARRDHLQRRPGDAGGQYLEALTPAYRPPGLIRPIGRQHRGGQHRNQALPLINFSGTGPKARLSLLSARLSPSKKYSSGPLNHSLN